MTLTLSNLIATFAIVMLVTGTVHAQPVESKESRDARMGWWREAKFGMFIHWGVSAVPAGIYHGKSIQFPWNLSGKWI